MEPCNCALRNQSAAGRNGKRAMSCLATLHAAQNTSGTTGKFFSGICEARRRGASLSREESAEFCQAVLSHRARRGGEEFKAGDAFVLPAGFEGTWNIEPCSVGYPGGLRRGRKLRGNRNFIPFGCAARPDH